MPKRLVATFALVVALVPSAARGGVTLHYAGTVRAEGDAAGAIADAVAFAKARGWAFEQRAGGVVLRPHPWSEPVTLQFQGRSLAKEQVKTQFAGPETHIAVIDLFRSLQPRFEKLSVEDEGEYWETSDREKLVTRMQSDGLMMVRIQESTPGTTGPYVFPDGRIVDIATSPAELGITPLAAAGAKLLAAPFVPARPWAPKLPSLAATPGDRWRRFETKDERFAVSFPGAPERRRSENGSAVFYTASSGAADFIVYAARPVVGENAAGVLRDIPAALANGHVGRILSDERAMVNGLRVRTVKVLDERMGMVFQHRAVIVGNRPYFLRVAARDALPADEDVRAFFDSFRALE